MIWSQLPCGKGIWEAEASFVSGFVVIQLSRACGRPSLRLDILHAHSDHSSIPSRSMVSDTA
ncbi:hypothetical protein [Rubritalea tangerina]|uniref:hypothetical protein n=1 Tax=Rubritalea tangerina TaxID=430798 RepID=UPI003614A5A1